VTTKVQKNDGVISPASYGSDVDLTYDYYYNAYRGKYLTKGYWRWKNSNWDFFPTPDDAFGLWLRKTDGVEVLFQILLLAQADYQQHCQVQAHGKHQTLSQFPLGRNIKKEPP